MIWAFLALNVFVVMAVAYVRYSGSALAHAAPVAMGPSGWLWTLAAAEGLFVLAVVAGRKRLAGPGPARRALAELMLLPAAFVLVWGFLPPKVSQYTVAHWACIAVLAGAVAGAVRLDRRGAADLGLTGRNFGAAARRLAVPTAVMVAAPIVTAAFLGTDFEPGRAAASAAGYPVYALVQLLVFQVFLVPRLVRLSDSRAAVIAVASAVFALAHWPNALVMVVCAAGSAVWTWVYLTRPNAYALALSMALSAVSFTHALPRDLTHHVRVGPMYVYRAVQHSSAGRK